MPKPPPADHWSRQPPPIGTVVCFEHGPIEPDRTQAVACCPRCRAIAWHVVADKRGRRGYAPDRPTRCGNGHELQPGRVSVSNDRCGVHDSHWSWRCGECGDRQAWPPIEDGCAGWVPPPTVG